MRLLRFSDFANEVTLEGDKVKIEQILDKEIILKAYLITKSKYPQKDNEYCLELQSEMDGKVYVTFTGSVVLMDKIEKYKDHLPFITTIKKINKSYMFT